MFLSCSNLSLKFNGYSFPSNWHLLSCCYVTCFFFFVFAFKKVRTSLSKKVFVSYWLHDDDDICFTEFQFYAHLLFKVKQQLHELDFSQSKTFLIFYIWFVQCDIVLFGRLNLQHSRQMNRQKDVLYLKIELGIWVSNLLSRSSADPSFDSFGWPIRVWRLGVSNAQANAAVYSFVTRWDVNGIPKKILFPYN
jgi:hypothetical protein